MHSMLFLIAHEFHRMPKKWAQKHASENSTDLWYQRMFHNLRCEIVGELVLKTRNHFKIT